MAPSAGYNALIKVGGTATTITDEATTELDAGPPQVFQITNTAKRVLDPATAVVIKDETTADVTSDFTIDFNTGTVTSATGGYVSVTISGKYIPLHTVAQCTVATINASMAELDSSELGEVFTKLECGKGTAEVEITRLGAMSDVLDGGSLTWQSIFDGRTLFLLEVAYSTRLFVSWGRLLGIPSELPQDGLVSHSLSFKSTPRLAVTQNTEVGFSFTDA
jgi:hypothetical protein